MRPFRTILSFAFAMLVLFSSTNIMIGLHICRGEIQNIALFSKADDCEMEKRMPPCHKQDSQQCCKDEAIIHSSQGFNAPPVDIASGPLVPVNIEVQPVLISEVIPPAPFSLASLYNYDPPLRAADLSVSFHVFLI